VSEDNIDTLKLKSLRVTDWNIVDRTISGNHMYVDTKLGLITRKKGMDALDQIWDNLPSPEAKLKPQSWSIYWPIASCKNQSPVNAYNADLFDDDSNDYVKISVAKHPLMNHLFEDIEYDRNMKICILGLGVARSNNVVIRPHHQGKPTAYSIEFNTSGFRIKVSSKITNKIREMANMNQSFSDQTLLIIAHWIRKSKSIFGLQNSNIINSYLDLICNLAWQKQSDYSNENSFPNTELDFLNHIFSDGGIISDEDIQQRAKLNSVANDLLLQNIIREINELEDIMRVNYENLLNDWQEIKHDWMLETAMNTLGVQVAESIADFAGVNSESIGYATEQEDGNHFIYVYDNEEESNGSCELAHKYFHIPAEIRKVARIFDEKNLPTRSVTDIIEEKLQICQEFMMHQSSIQDVKLKSLSKLHDEQDILRNKYSDIWDELEVKSTDDAALHLRRRFAFRNPDERGSQLEVELALRLCSNGCDACNGDAMMNNLPPHLVDFATNRKLLDEIIGGFDNIIGYSLMKRDRENILNEFTNLNSTTESLNVRKDLPGANTYKIEFSNTIGKAVGIYGTRTKLTEDDSDYVVRTMEMV